MLCHDIIPLTHTHDNNPSILSELKVCRTDQVAYVLDYHEVEIGEWKIFYRMIHEMRIKMTLLSSVHGNGRYIMTLEA